jgi:hypothetical protein
MKICGWEDVQNYAILTSDQIEVTGHFQDQTLPLWQRVFRCAMDKKLGRSKGHSGSCEKERNISAYDDS